MHALFAAGSYSAPQPRRRQSTMWKMWNLDNCLMARQRSRRVRTAPRVPRDAAIDAWLLSTEQVAAGSTPFLPGETPVVLTEAAVPPQPAGERVQAILALLADPDKARECAETKTIETPDYCTAEQSTGRTRGLSATEDTSDEVYVQRNAKHERHEKRLRRLEKEGLVRERERVNDRIARVQRMDLSLLVPAMQGQSSSASDAPADAGSGTPQISAEAALAHLEERRALYLADAIATRARLDKLLPSTAAPTAAGGRGQRRDRAPGFVFELPARIAPGAFDDVMAAWLPDNREIRSRIP